MIGHLRVRVVRPLLLMSFLLGCSGEPSQPTPAGALDRSCNNVEYEAARLAAGGNDREALDRYGEAVALCEDVPLIRNRVLDAIADIARRSTEHCGLARELHARAASWAGTDYLRSRVHLSYACGPPTDLESEFDRLVREASRHVYGEAAAEMEPFVRSHERMQLDHWASNPSRHLQSLREATRQLCADDGRIALVLDSVHRVGIGSDNGLSLLGFWTLQPGELLDEDSRACLSHVASRIEARETEFDPRIRQDMTALLHWVRNDFQDAPAGH